MAANKEWPRWSLSALKASDPFRAGIFFTVPGTGRGHGFGEAGGALATYSSANCMESFRGSRAMIGRFGLGEHMKRYWPNTCHRRNQFPACELDKRLLPAATTHDNWRLSEPRGRMRPYRP
jgi:hypothetical protein